MPTIDFQTYNPTTLQNFKPVLAKNVVPDWWKKAKVGESINGTFQQTIRSCPAMDDWLKMGWYLLANRDLHVKCGVSSFEEGDTSSWFHLEDGEGDQWLQNYESQSHPSTQTLDAFSYYGAGDNAPIKDAFKCKNPWNIKTPKGYSCFYLDPFLHQNKYFATWQGIIDTDEFNVNLDNAQIIFYPKVSHSFTIKKGTPLCQIIPFKREEWAASYTTNSMESYINNLTVENSTQENISMTEANAIDVAKKKETIKRIGPYKKRGMWKPKQKFFTEDTPPPECPFHVSAENPAPSEIQLELNFGDETNGS